MRPLRYSAFAVCLLLQSLAFAQREDWLPITNADLQVNQVPGRPGAPALMLYYANYIDDEEGTEFIYERIKILNDAGKKYADLEIPAAAGVSIGSLKARSIQPDGSIAEFTGKPFKKTVFVSRGIKRYVEAFTLPKVSVGSIVEYKYKLNNYRSDLWILQHSLYTLKENFSFHAAAGDVQVSYVSLNLEDAKPLKKHGRIELELENVPAFEAEDYMPPEDNYKPSVRFYYSRGDLGTADRFWREIGKQVNSWTQGYIGHHKEIVAAAREAMGAETDPEKKLRKLYARAQLIRNLTYERERTPEELRKEKIEDNENVVEILKRGYGDSVDITVLFAAMARAAGFDVSLLLVSDRKELFFTNDLLSLRQLSLVVAGVKLNGKEVYLQPGARFCPFGLLRWNRTSTPALRLDPKGGKFITTPPATYEQSLTKRTATMAIAEDGAIKGEVTVEFQGQEAMEHRLDALGLDEAGRNRDLENELKEWLPAGARVQLNNVEGWEAGESLLATFDVEVPSYASITGKRFLLSPSLFQEVPKDAFNHVERKYPIYFPYGFTEKDQVNIKFPPGYSLEDAPPEQAARLDYATYENRCRAEGSQLVTQRALVVNGIFFDASKYATLKDFFNKVRTGDGQQLVLRVGGEADGHTSN